jgi:hypothetical protein
MASNWFVIQIEGADDGTVKLLPSSDAAQEYITVRIADGVPPDRLRLLNADDVPFGVTYQPIVSIGADGPKAAKPPAFTPGTEPSTAANGGSPAQEPVTVSAVSGNGAASSAKQPAGTQDGVRMSSQFPPA